MSKIKNTPIQETIDEIFYTVNNYDQIITKYNNMFVEISFAGISTETMKIVDSFQKIVKHKLDVMQVYNKFKYVYTNLLDKTDQKYIKMYYLNKLSYNEIATHLNMATDTARIKVNIATERFYTHYVNLQTCNCF